MSPSDKNPDISVVMSVFNGSLFIDRTIQSILHQTCSHFEFVIVNDGSTDDTLGKLRHYESQDSRIRVISGDNQGLTKALNLACDVAKSPLIARQDVGDISLPTRLQRQLEFLNAHPEVVAVGCGSHRLTESGELLGSTVRNASPAEITRQLLSEGTGILHATSMFRLDSFRAAGGYRSQFRFAQDTDLWLRLSEIGLIGEVPEILFDMVVDDYGISASRIEQQVALWKLARQCAQARRNGASEQEFLDAAEKISSSASAGLSPKARQRMRNRSRYFIGSQLLQMGNPGCRRYFVDALRVPALFVPSLAKILLSFAKCRRQ